MKKILFLLFLTLLLCTSSAAQKKVSYQRDYRYLVERIDGVYIPKDIDEAIDSLDVILSAEDKRYVADSLSLEDFCNDLGLGSEIRAMWGFWGGSRLQKYFNDKKVFNPDYMSYLILKAYYETKLKGMTYSPEELIVPDFDSDPTIVNEDNLPQEQLERRKKQIAETKKKMRKDGFAKGKIVYFQFPYGCSTLEEEDTYLDADSCKPLPRGRITDIAIDGYYLEPKIKVKLLSTISPYGIIVFDGDVAPKYYIKNDERDFDSFTIYSPNRFYMQKGDELWFDLDSHCWALDES
ncbi:MAG: hypothetical protein IKQ01_08665 [Bacteroidales bacterium]|nr:hypothetical protein [Bacteroidales bacterium]